ncbi:hypothetical protein Q9306_14050 [Bacillus sp. WLY-B-L8]|nr:hypothetical protein [Bacillus sp. WLY-B-L8]
MFKQREEESIRLLFVQYGGDLYIRKSSWIYIYGNPVQKRTNLARWKYTKLKMEGQLKEKCDIL